MARSSFFLSLVILILVPVSSLAQSPGDACVELPSNIRVADGYRAWVVDLIARSPTLHRQCVAIARAPSVAVRFDFTHRLIGVDRARTSFTRDRGQVMSAVIAIPLSRDFTELLAHELEHVVEQIEGVNLRRLSQVRDSGVRQVGHNVFETTRALAAGRAAARETRRPIAVVAAKD